METVLCMFGFFAVVGWFTSLEELHIMAGRDFFGLTEVQARERVMRPAFRAGIWACRVGVVALFVGMVPIAYYKVHDQSDKAFLLAAASGGLSWLYFYWRLNRSA
jgi:hypothetical protein